MLRIGSGFARSGRWMAALSITLLGVGISFGACGGGGGCWACVESGDVELSRGKSKEHWGGAAIFS